MGPTVLGTGWTSDTVLDLVARHAERPLALIDTGALISNMSNVEVAMELLRRGLEHVDGVVYMDQEDRQMVLLRDRYRTSLLTHCGIPPERRFTFYDQVHATGQDIRQCATAMAMITVGPNMTYRDYSQGAWRMREVGRGQTLHLVVPRELDRVIEMEQGEAQLKIVQCLQWLVVKGVLEDVRLKTVLEEQQRENAVRKQAFVKMIETSDDESAIDTFLEYKEYGVDISMTESCGCNGQHKKLTCPPGNLKECIDWILRVTNKDNGRNGGKSGNGGEKLGKEVGELLEGANQYLERLTNDARGDATDKLKKDQQVLQAVKQQLNDGPSNLITALADKLKNFLGGIKNGNGGATNKYTSSYDNVSAENEQQQLCGLIFLGALPLMFSGLSYLYWRCNKGNRDGATAGERWTNATKITNTNAGIGVYFACCGYNTSHLNDTKNAGEIKNLLGTNCFKEEFNNGATANVQDDYSKYINGVLTNTNATEYPLSSLYLASQYYFQYKFNNGTHVPTTIREMLYWLMALPYSACFQLAPATIRQGIHHHNSSGSGGTKEVIEFHISYNTDITLDSDTDPFDCYLSTTCHYAGVVLCTIQGTLITNGMTKTVNKKLTLADIYSNDAFNFNYPTTANALFPVLWDIIYCLLFQLYFLKSQCRTCFGAGRGWRWCKYGKEIKDDGCSSWICTVQTINEHANNRCNYAFNCKPDNHTKCGQSDNPSPLQACLKDKLLSFQCANDNTKLAYTDHVSHRNFNQYCFVPMGFNKDCLSQSHRTGHYIEGILDYFTQSDRDSVSLYNIIICLICCSLRTPRTVGDLFCFFLRIGENMQNGDLATAIENESKNISWKCKDASSITDAVKTLAGEEHTDESDEAGEHSDNKPTLHSLYDSTCGSNVTCGSYLEPLSNVIYCNISEIFAGTYIQGIVYLTDVFEKGLRDLLARFTELKCEHDKHTLCPAGCHGNGNNCQCPTIVQCGDVLPLFFKFGFVYYDHHALNETGGNGRKCSAFANQLQNVIDKAFSNLLSSINIFLYHIRQPFLLYLLTFYLLAIIYLTYSLTIPLDVLHLRSHLRTAVLSPLVLLTNYTQPHDITYFKP
ncbi:uncharacterized protein BXIN_2426 [Babesia sp. Xinjiang]|uniref:uncharacterized protein n=1 Tax=Babesia sp. Xinjiang TaxID=462227 RepID=UPI000A2665AB|nr:uncharacterized protein BXIN_2426 [Babesia sp. Xinjiang]ORM39890.1 hypothetical protein BXIN_2426 [Babesia sp. Xinjiang]